MFGCGGTRKIAAPDDSTATRATPRNTPGDRGRQKAPMQNRRKPPPARIMWGRMDSQSFMLS
jgi:hypothetical protein